MPMEERTDCSQLWLSINPCGTPMGDPFQHPTPSGKRIKLKLAAKPGEKSPNQATAKLPEHQSAACTPLEPHQRVPISPQAGCEHQQR